MAEETAKTGNGKATPALTGVAGAGVGAIVMAVLQGQPEIVSQIAGWGPGVLILVGLGWISRPFIESHQRMAGTLSDLAGAVRESLNRDQSVQMSMNTLAGRVEELVEEVRQFKRGQ